jgi:hypothetical protein
LRSQLADLEQRLASRETELRESQETCDQTLLELHQTQQKAEVYFMADGEKQHQLEAGARELEELRRSKTALNSAHVQELQALRQRLEPQLADLQQHLASRDTELREVRKEAERSLAQLHQAQVELEHYFLADGEKQRQLEAGARDRDELMLIKAAQESAHEQELDTLRQRLELQLADLEQRLASRDTELLSAREASELSLLQLHQQLQEERQIYLMADGEKQQQLVAGARELDELRLIKAAQESAHEQELETLRQRLELQLADLEQRLASRDTELREVRKEAELSLLQLHQVQEELEHYFLKARASDQIAQAQLEQLQRAQGLMVRLHPDVLPSTPYPPAIAVEVMPEVAAAVPDPTLQTKALLSTYAASLQRASAIVERARRR